MSDMRRIDGVMPSKKATFSKKGRKDIKKQSFKGESSENEDKEFSNILIQRLVKNKKK